MQILGLLGMCFDAVIVEVELYVFTFFQIGSGHTVGDCPSVPTALLNVWARIIAWKVLIATNTHGSILEIFAIICAPDETYIAQWSEIEIFIRKLYGQFFSEIFTSNWWYWPPYSLFHPAYKIICKYVRYLWFLNISKSILLDYQKIAKS